MKPINNITSIQMNNQSESNYSGSVVDPNTGNTTGLIKRHKSNINPFYIRVYPNMEQFHKMVAQITTVSTYKVLACVMWCLQNTLITNSDIICLTYDIYLEYCKKLGIPNISRASYYKGIKELIGYNVIKNSKDIPKQTFRVNFSILATGKYKQETF